jgi:hypothetical protein
MLAITAFSLAGFSVVVAPPLLGRHLPPAWRPIALEGLRIFLALAWGCTAYFAWIRTGRWPLSVSIALAIVWLIYLTATAWKLMTAISGQESRA